ncbi:MAG: hypothetical protein ACP5VR_01570 [Acidimicrobiales bacterium]
MPAAATNLPLATARSDSSTAAPSVSHKLAHFCRRARCRLRAALCDERGSQITDNLGLIVIGIVAIVAIGGLISGLDTTIFNWVTKQLGLGG